MAKNKKAKATPKPDVSPNVEPASTIGNPAPKVENTPDPAQKPTEQLTGTTHVGTPTIHVESAQEPRPEKLLHTHDGSKALTAQEYEKAQGIIK